MTEIQTIPGFEKVEMKQKMMQDRLEKLEEQNKEIISQNKDIMELLRKIINPNEN